VDKASVPTAVEYGSVGPESNAKVRGFCLMLVSRTKRGERENGSIFRYDVAFFVYHSFDFWDF